MSFRLHEPQKLNIEGLPKGQCSIDKNGNARFHLEDLALVGIEGCVACLVDELTMRIALRKPRPNEKNKTLCVALFASKKNSTTPDRASIRLTGPLRDMSLQPEAARGRYELTTKDDLIIINLASGDESEDPPPAKEKGTDDDE